MLLVLAAFAQAVSATPPEVIDLTIPQPCEAPAPHSDEIVVCATPTDGLGPYRIGQASPPRPAVPKAEVQLAEGVSASAETESQDVGGVPSNRLMLRLKVKF